MSSATCSQADSAPNIPRDLLQAAEAIDQLVTVDVVGRGVVGGLYEAARARSKIPLVLEAALGLKGALFKSETVFIATGWPDRVEVDGSVAESDGPPGAAVLARALHRAFGVVPFVLTEVPLVSALQGVLAAAGFRVLPPKAALRALCSRGPVHPAAAVAFPTAAERAEEEARALLDQYRPGAVVVIEKGGPNREGIIRSCRGEDVSCGHARVDVLIAQARKRGIYTLGIGDGGNEIGMGLIRDRAEEILAGSLGTSVEGGCVPQVITDSLQVAAVSNWGAYGIAACLALLVGRREVLHDVEVERRVLESCVRAGLIDGVTGYVEGSVDGVSQKAHLALVQLLETVVESALRRGGT